MDSSQVTSTSVAGNMFRLRQIRKRSNKEAVTSQSVGDVTFPQLTLVILLGWFRPRPGAVEKYCDIYHQHGYSVLFVPGALAHFAWPQTSMTLARTLLDYLCNDETMTTRYRYFIVHAFSVGAYNFTSCLMLLHDEHPRYLTFTNKLQGVVFDSLTLGSLERMTTGLVTGMSKNQLLRNFLLKFMSVYYYFTYKQTVTFFDKGIDFFQKYPAVVPTLLFYSRDDPMLDAEVMDELVTEWRRRGTFPVTARCWDESIHTAHLHCHANEYISDLDAFLRIVTSQSARRMSETVRSPVTLQGNKSKL
jgi:hypothetical protein